MPERANSLAPAFIAGTLAAGTLLGLNTTASAACLENPDLRIAEPGHWYYHSDRQRNRRCWFFVSAEVTANTPVSAPPPTTAGYDPQQSLLSFLTAGLLQPASPQPMGVAQAQPVGMPQAQPMGMPQAQPMGMPQAQPMGMPQAQPVGMPQAQPMGVPQAQPSTIPDRLDEATRTMSPRPARPNKVVRRERPQAAPPPATTGVAERGDQPEQSAGKDKQDSPLTAADREALFNDFVKWQFDRNLFGRP